MSVVTILEIMALATIPSRKFCIFGSFLGPLVIDNLPIGVGAIRIRQSKLALGEAKFAELTV